LTLVWLFNIEGTVDLLNAIYLGLATGITSYQLGAAWFIPTVYVPALLVTHALIFVLLLSGGRGQKPARTVRNDERLAETLASGR
jgi:hypothetical protein